MDDWLSFPDDALLTLQRRTMTGDRQQWVVAGSGDAIVVRCARLSDGAWDMLDGRYGSLEDAMRGVPELRTVRKGEASEYTLGTGRVSGEFTRLLNLVPSDGDEDPAAWPDEVAAEWAWVRESLDRFPSDRLLVRWASVDDGDQLITGFPGPVFVNLVLDEYEDGCPQSVRDIARCWWAVENTSAPISWAGGYSLEEVAPRLAVSRPYNDEAEVGGAPWFIALPGDPEEQCEAIARWIIDCDAEVGAAITFENFDPGSMLDDEQRYAWDVAMGLIEIGVSADPHQGLLREKLAELSDLYRDTRDALADPNGKLGQRLLAAYDEGLYTVRSGEWRS